jgi:hypothetical protein
MPPPDQISMPPLGQEGEPCVGCGTPLAADQRYCLNCGTRRGEARLPFETYLAAPGVSGAVPAGGVAPPAPRSNDVSPLGVVLGVALLGGMLLIGVLLGRGNNDSSQTPQVVTVGSGTATASTADSGSGSTEAASDKVVSDWPEGKEGWTVELGTLPKSGTTAADVDSTEQDLTSKGASELGVLDSDVYPSLPAGNYVIYSGVYDTQADANAALKKLGSGFPDAQVVQVSSSKPVSNTGGGGGGKSGGGGASTAGGSGSIDAPVQASTQDLQALQNQTDPDKIPDTIATPGKAPPDNPNVTPGGGSSATVIK